MVKCVFCGRDEQPHKGLHLILNVGTVAYYCSNKCRKNAFKLGRDKRALKWTEAFRIEQQHTAAQAARAQKLAVK